jgi:hypothetical protein
MYKVIGGDQKEYGSVTADQMRRWIAEGRVNGQTQVLAEGATQWQNLSEIPEFADALAARAAAAPPPVLGQETGLPPGLFDRDYELDIGRCVAEGWGLLKNNFGLVFGGVAIYMIIQGALSGLAQIPFVGLVFSVASLIITGPLTAGAYYLLLKLHRRQPADIGDIFAGFRLGFGQLLLGYVVPALLSGVAALPGAVVAGVPIYLMVRDQAAVPGRMLVAAIGLLIMILPLIYFTISWMLTLPLIIDRQVPFWPAMEASRKMVGKHWWAFFGLVVVCGLINLLGACVCCVGFFISLPIGFGAVICAYESIFSASAARAD